MQLTLFKQKGITGIEIVFAIAVIVAAIALLIAYFDIAVIDNSDVRVREKYADLSCSEVAQTPIDTLIEDINTLIEGTTGDDDEDTINKILLCTSINDNCAKARKIWEERAEEIDSNTQGAQWKHTKQIALICGLQIP